VKPVPPRIRIRIGFTVLPIDPAPAERFSEKALAPGINPKPIVPPAMAESLRKVLLLVDIYSLLKNSIFDRD
jgi:hypothetical protein